MTTNEAIKHVLNECDLQMEKNTNIIEAKTLKEAVKAVEALLELPAE